MFEEYNELYSEPLEIIDSLSEKRIEMTSFEVGFLCGQIKRKRPRKIAEIGVSAGGTTAVILNCMNKLDLDAELFSVDLNPLCYKDNTKRTGYLAEEAMQLMEKKPRHTLLTGGLSADFLGENVLSQIDFLILDTVHDAPGEILDLLAFMPYLSDEAVVVLHDIALHHIDEDFDNGYATQVLLSCVAADKIIPYDDTRSNGFPNIASFTVNQDTKKYIGNVFMSLLTPWGYIPEEWVLDKYRALYRRHYDNEMLRIFDAACALNRASFRGRGMTCPADFKEFR